jgi:hypothetical protein
MRAQSLLFVGGALGIGPDLQDKVNHPATSVPHPGTLPNRGDDGFIGLSEVVFQQATR